jgi:hypothetical protein
LEPWPAKLLKALKASVRAVLAKEAAPKYCVPSTVQIPVLEASRPTLRPKFSETVVPVLAAVIDGEAKTEKFSAVPNSGTEAAHAGIVGIKPSPRTITDINTIGFLRKFFMSFCLFFYLFIEITRILP